MLQKDQKANLISTNYGTTNSRDTQISEYGYPDIKRTTLSDRTQETLGKLQELSNTLSQYEADVVARSSRLSSSDRISDASSIGSGVPMISNGRGPSKGIIDSDENSGLGYGFAHLSIENGQDANLPGVYRHYLLVRPLSKFTNHVCITELTTPRTAADKPLLQARGATTDFMGIRRSF